MSDLFLLMVAANNSIGCFMTENVPIPVEMILLCAS